MPVEFTGNRRDTGILYTQIATACSGFNEHKHLYQAVMQCVTQQIIFSDKSGFNLHFSGPLSILVNLFFTMNLSLEHIVVVTAGAWESDSACNKVVLSPESVFPLNEIFLTLTAQGVILLSSNLRKREGGTEGKKWAVKNLMVLTSWRKWPSRTGIWQQSMASSFCALILYVSGRILLCYVAQAGLKPWAQAVLTSALCAPETPGAHVSGLVLMLHVTQ